MFFCNPPSGLKAHITQKSIPIPYTGCQVRRLVIYELGFKASSGAYTTAVIHCVVSLPLLNDFLYLLYYNVPPLSIKPLIVYIFFTYFHGCNVLCEWALIRTTVVKTALLNQLQIPVEAPRHANSAPARNSRCGQTPTAS